MHVWCYTRQLCRRRAVYDTQATIIGLLILTLFKVSRRSLVCCTSGQARERIGPVSSIRYATIMRAGIVNE